MIREDSDYEPGHGVILGGSIRVPLPLEGCSLVVHMPSDETGSIKSLDINTRFEGGEAFFNPVFPRRASFKSRLPSAANPYSGKWNFSCFEDEDLLFDTFVRCFETLHFPEK